MRTSSRGQDRHDHSAELNEASGVPTHAGDKSEALAGSAHSISSICAGEWMRSPRLSVAHDYPAEGLTACGLEERIVGLATRLPDRLTAACESSGRQSQMPPRVGSAQPNVCLPRKP